MKERPILFSVPMVRAILEGRKTQTRRIAPIIDLNIRPNCDDMVTWGISFSKPIKGALGSYSGGKFSIDQAQRIIASMFNPYGVPGDRLWVREAFCDATNSEQNRVLYRSSGDIACGWKPSIHMPRWASRINLEITGVRVDKLQNISEADAEAEGVDFLRNIPDADETLTAKQLYWCLWDSINGAGSWFANPWVWVVEFKRVAS